eukprot:TRINITY_DN519_c0_g1_i2.p1 TRINITY_DN519_c0_g1~~TRINITY_DN519_c0_g1_i2.p1  ORF type:complete len:572 (+),score=79.25 TRINITY_DN519_c0_g1_i2:85-1800(+)
MKCFIATVGLLLVGLALSDPLACDGQSCMVENDQAAMLQSSLLHKGEASGAIAGEDDRPSGQFCYEAKDYGCYPKTGLPECCSDGRRETCGRVKPPCDTKGERKGKGKGGSRRRRRPSGSWGREIDHTYCTGSYDRQDSKEAAKRACKRDDACGGIYEPGNDPGKWFLCNGFSTFASTSNSVVIEKLSGSSSSSSPDRSSSSDTRRRHLPSSSSCWGSEVAGYCSGSYGTGDSKSEAESQCVDTADCGGIYQPGQEPRKWYLCEGFDLFTSTSGSRSIKKECDASPSSSSSHDDDRRRRARYPSSASSSGCWGSEQDGYCSGSYDGHNQRSEAESACNADAGCGGIYQPGNEPGKWYLCKGFDVYASTTGSKCMKKQCDLSSSLSTPTDFDRRRREPDDRRRHNPYPSSSSCWGSEVAGYCSGSYGTGNSKSEAESQCVDTADCGGIYQPGQEPGKWYLCKGFDMYASTTGSKSIKKQCGSSSSPSTPTDSDRRRREQDYRRRYNPYPSPSSSQSGSSCKPCSYSECQSNQCASQNRFMCTSGPARGGCNGGSSYWGSTNACTACCDTSSC